MRPAAHLAIAPIVIRETEHDADGTEYLDAMAGLWCVNIGYGRSELAEVASEQMPFGLRHSIGH